MRRLDLLLLVGLHTLLLFLCQGLLLQVLAEPQRRLRAQYPRQHEEEDVLGAIQHLVRRLSRLRFHSHSGGGRLFTSTSTRSLFLGDSLFLCSSDDYSVSV